MYVNCYTQYVQTVFDLFDKINNARLNLYKWQQSERQLNF